MVEPFPSSTRRHAYDVESTIDEYARENGLSLDSTLDPLFFLSSVAHLDYHNPSQSAADLLGDNVELPRLQLPSCISLPELPRISTASLERLNTAISREDESQISHLTLLASQPPRSRRLKLELPLLRSDHESDCGELERAIKSQRAIRIQKDSLVSEPLIVSQDEALDFPGSAYSYRDKLEAATSNDRLAVARDVLQYLGMALQDTWSSADTATFLSHEITPLRIARTIQFTPPLSPLTIADECYVPDPDISQIPLSSDPSTLFGQDMEDAHTALVQRGSSSPQHAPFELSPLGDTPNPSPKLPHMNSIKVEGPLTPENSSEPTSDQVIDIQQAASGLELGQDADADASDMDIRRDFKDLSSNDLMRTLREGAEHASRRVDQECLEATDAIARVAVPVMDFTLPDPGWNVDDPSSRRQFERIMVNIDSRHVPNWPRDSGTESKMRWNPFPSSLGQVSLTEPIEEEIDLQSLLDFPSQTDVLSSSAYVWKQPGLTILRDTESEEELDSPQYQPGSNTDLNSLVKKRKLEMEANDLNLSADSSFPAQASLVDLGKAPQVRLTSVRDDLTPDGAVAHLLGAINDPSAAATRLANYVDFRTSKRRKTARSVFFGSFKPVKLNANANATGTPTSAAPLPEHQGSTPVPDKSISPAPCPKLATGVKAADVIIATTLGSDIVSLLEKLLPKIRIIEKDFNRYNAITWNPNSISRSTIISPLATEADVIVSPGTGIVVTTLIRAIQKPLPGQKGKAAIRERIERIADKYERLIVLVSAANRFDESAGDISTSECAALSEFIAFVAGLDTNGQVYFVGGGGDETLSKWLAFFITRYSIEAVDVRGWLLPDDTTWEVALRRAGLNAFAAQAVLAFLKPPEDTPEEAMGNYGLSGFINMSPAQRVQEFSLLMGGERVLQRVTEVLDSAWS